MIKWNDQGNFPYTPSIPLLYGLKETLAMLKEEARRRRADPFCARELIRWRAVAQASLPLLVLRLTV